MATATNAETVTVDVNAVIDILGFLDHCRDVVSALNEGQESPLGRSFRREGDRFFQACFGHGREEAFAAFDNPRDAAMNEAGIETAAEAMTSAWAEKISARDYLMAGVEESCPGRR
jgi:hypothetical protein